MLWGEVRREWKEKYKRMFRPPNRGEATAKNGSNCMNPLNLKKSRYIKEKRLVTNK